MSVNSVEERILAAAKYKLNMDEKVIQAGKFDQKSTGSERRQMLQSILQDEEMDEEEENEVPDEETVNQMIARSEEELQIYQQLDLERRREEAKLGAARKPRLIEETELPDWLIRDEAEIDELTAEEDDGLFGRGSRQRKEVDYSDSLNDRDWLKAIGAVDDEGNEILEDEEDEPSGKKRGRRGGGAARGPGRRKDEEEDDRPRKKRGRPSGSPGVVSPRLRHGMRSIVQMIVDYVDADGRVLSEPFMKLPSRKDLPDYYKVIRKPVDIKKILTRIDENKYGDLDELETDCILMCKNAQAYNEEASLIHEDSIVLERVFANARAKVEAELEAQPEQENAEDAEEDPGDAAAGKRKGRGAGGRPGPKKRRKLRIVDDDDEDEEEEQDEESRPEAADE